MTVVLTHLFKLIFFVFITVKCPLAQRNALPVIGSEFLAAAASTDMATVE